MADLPQTRKVELLVSSVDVLGPCCSCREKEGVLRCSGCKAVRYCGQECQDKGWNDHKQICNEINQLLQQVKAAIEALANEYGGVESLLEAPLVKDGHFKFRDRFLSIEDPSNFRFVNKDRPTKPEEYDIARWKLINAYARCGKEASSKLAFSLAAENLLHMLRLCRNANDRPHMPPFTWHKYCGWMVAGEKDQQALNFLGYFGYLGNFPGRSGQEDIEGLSVVNRVKAKVTYPFEPRLNVHDFMLISLIKFKRIKALSVQRKGEEERWNTFLEGTESRSGESSVVLVLSGMAPVLEKLRGFVVDKSIDERSDSLTNQVNELLIEVNEENPRLIQGVLDRPVQMVANPTFPDNYREDNYREDNYREDNYQYQSHCGYTGYYIPDDERNAHIARYAVGKYGHAWLIENDSTRALRLFLETGNIMEEEEGNSLQTEITEVDTGTAGEDTSPDTVTEDTSLQTGMAEKKDKNPGTLKHDDNVPNSGEIWKMKEKSNSNGIKVDEDVSNDREREGKNSVEEKGLGLSDFCDNDNQFKGFSGKLKENEDKDFKDDKEKTEESS